MADAVAPAQKVLQELFGLDKLATQFSEMKTVVDNLKSLVTAPEVKKLLVSALSEGLEELLENKDFIISDQAKTAMGDAVFLGMKKVLLDPDVHKNLQTGFVNAILKSQEVQNMQVSFFDLFSKRCKELLLSEEIKKSLKAVFTENLASLKEVINLSMSEAIQNFKGAKLQGKFEFVPDETVKEVKKLIPPVAKE